MNSTTLILAHLKTYLSNQIGLLSHNIFDLSKINFPFVFHSNKFLYPNQIICLFSYSQHKLPIHRFSSRTHLVLFRFQIVKINLRSKPITKLFCQLQENKTMVSNHYTLIFIFQRFKLFYLKTIHFLKCVCLNRMAFIITMLKVNCCLFSWVGS